MLIRNSDHVMHTVTTQEIKNRKELTAESLDKLEAIVMDSAKAQV
jgi:hypothetical protein